MWSHRSATPEGWPSAAVPSAFGTSLTTDTWGPWIPAWGLSRTPWPHRDTVPSSRRGSVSTPQGTLPPSQRGWRTRLRCAKPTLTTNVLPSQRNQPNLQPWLSVTVGLRTGPRSMRSLRAAGWHYRTADPTATSTTPPAASCRHCRNLTLAASALPCSTETFVHDQTRKERSS